MQKMTVGQLVELLEEWPMTTEITFGDQPGVPRQYVDGDPVLVATADGGGVAMPDALYIGLLSDERAKELGWL